MSTPQIDARRAYLREAGIRSEPREAGRIREEITKLCLRHHALTGHLPFHEDEELDEATPGVIRTKLLPILRIIQAPHDPTRLLQAAQALMDLAREWERAGASAQRPNPSGAWSPFHGRTA